jgi:hypothetical protein
MQAPTASNRSKLQTIADKISASRAKLGGANNDDVHKDGLVAILPPPPA